MAVLKSKSSFQMISLAILLSKAMDVNSQQNLHQQMTTSGGSSTRSSSSSSGSSPCPLECKNGGVCLLGKPSPSEESPSAILEQNAIELDDFFCDCTNATDEEGSLFAGKFCEYKAAEYCDNGGGGDSGSHFCISPFGKCNPNYPSQGPMCFCDGSRGGPHCEYEKGSVPACDLDCQNNGHCVLGESLDSDTSHYWDNSENQHDMKHCVCLNGFDGILCEHRKEACGDGHCFNGASCLEKIGTDGGSHFRCDCNSANTEGKLYAGQFCQYEATSICSAEAQQEAGNLFCVNQGICKGNVYEGCNCPDGFTGFSCEFRMHQTSSLESPTGTSSTNSSQQPTTGQSIVDISAVDDPEYYYCDDSICQNNGKCRKGSKDLGMLEDVALEVEHLNSTYDENFEHCVCPPGFAGVHCEHKMETCGKGEHLCAHGSKCVTDGIAHACDCSQTDSSVSEVFAGRSCEHKATQICTNAEDLGPGKPLSFCTNNGICKALVSATSLHAGCDCAEGWSGPHCELRVASKNQDTSASTPSNIKEAKKASDSLNDENGVVVMLSLSLALLAAIFLSCFCMLLQYRKQRAAATESAKIIKNDEGSYRDEPKISPHRDSVAPFPKRFHSSSSYPFASIMAEHQQTRQASRLCYPVMFIPANETDRLEHVEIC